MDGRQSEEHQALIDNCCDAIDGHAELLIPCETVRPTLEIALAMYQSDRLGQAVTLPLADEESVWG